MRCQTRSQTAKESVVCVHLLSPFDFVELQVVFQIKRAAIIAEHVSFEEYRDGYLATNVQKVRINYNNIKVNNVHYQRKAHEHVYYCKMPLFMLVCIPVVEVV